MNMKKAISLILALTMCVSLLSACDSGSGGKQTGNVQPSQVAGDTSNYPTADNPITLSFGHISPDTSDMHANAVKFKEAVEELTGGAVIIEIYPNGQLGSEETMLDSIFSGTMDMGIISANVAATAIPEFNSIVLPFFFNGFEQVGSVITNEDYYLRTREIVEANLICCVGMGVVAYYSWIQLSNYIRIGTLTSSLWGMPVFVPFAIMPICSTVMCVRFLMEIYLEPRAVGCKATEKKEEGAS